MSAFAGSLISGIACRAYGAVLAYMLASEAVKPLLGAIHTITQTLDHLP